MKTPPGQRTTTSKTGFTAYLELLTKHVEEAVEKGEKLALLLVDLTDLREVNTTLGYEGGRQLLSEVARRLDTLRRKRDRVIQYADQGFAVILPGIRNDGHAALAVNKILRDLSEPVEVLSQQIKMSVCIGAAIFPAHAKDATQLMQNAEIAQSSAMKAGDAWRIFMPSNTLEVTGLVGLEHELDAAIPAGALEMYFQPMIRLDDGQPCGAEALMRWLHPDRGFVPPDIFIEIADRGGQIFDLSWFALNTSLRELRAWCRDENFTVSVNVTPNIVQFVDLLDIVNNALQVWDIQPRNLMLEVTETALMNNPAASFRNLHGLRDLGVQIAIDDFGTGYSSLSYFKNIPATELKIDKSFVLNMKDDAADRQIVRSVIDLAHGFGLKVVAEGVEDEESATMLREWGCDLAQGYFFARPMPAQDMPAWLKAREPKPVTS